MEVTVARLRPIASPSRAAVARRPTQATGDRRSGTRALLARPEVFDPGHSGAELAQLLRSKAVLLPGVKVTLLDEKSGRRQAPVRGRAWAT